MDEDEVSGHIDLSVSDNVGVSRLQPSTETPSAARKNSSARKFTKKVIRSATSAFAVPGTARTNETLSRSIAPKVARKLGIPVLPILCIFRGCPLGWPAEYFASHASLSGALVLREDG